MINAQDVVNRLRSAKYDLPDDLDPDRGLFEQGLDSLDAANLIFEVERLYDVRIDMAGAARIETISQLAAFIQALKQA